MPKVLNRRRTALKPPQWNGGLAARDRGRPQRENGNASATRVRVMTLICRYNRECVITLVHMKGLRAVKKTSTGGTETRRGQRHQSTVCFCKNN